MGTAAFDTTEAGAVALADAEAVGLVALEVVVLGPAAAADADRIVAFGEVAVGFTEGAAAVLAGVYGRARATAKASAGPTGMIRHGTTFRLHRGSHGRQRKGAGAVVCNARAFG